MTILVKVNAHDARTAVRELRSIADRIDEGAQAGLSHKVDCASFFDAQSSCNTVRQFGIPSDDREPETLFPTFEEASSVSGRPEAIHAFDSSGRDLGRVAFPTLDIPTSFAE